MSDELTWPGNYRDRAVIETIRAVWPDDRALPFNDLGAVYDCDAFCVRSRNLNSNAYENFDPVVIWRDWRAGWHKHYEKGICVNRHITEGEIVELLADIKKEFGL